MDNYDLNLAKKVKDYYKSKIEEYDFLMKNEKFNSPIEKEVKMRNYKIYKEDYERLYEKISKDINGEKKKEIKIVKVKKSKKSKSRSKSPKASKRTKSRSKSPKASKRTKSRSKSPKASKRSKITVPITKVKKCVPKRSKSRSKRC